MCRIGAVCLIGVLIGPLVGRAEDDLGQARRLLLSGKYEEAGEIYGQSKTPGAALGLARSLAARGKLDEAVETLRRATAEHAEQHAERAELHAELARLAFQRGDYPAATGHVDKALALEPDQLLARWIRGELLRVAGRLDEATEAYRWLIEFYNDHDVDEAESLHWIGRAAAQYARWNRLSDQFSFLVNDLYPAALRREPDYWPAHWEAGLLYLEKYNQADAAYHLNAALELNPNAAEVHAALARLALVGREPDRAEAAADRALEINPGLQDAWLVKAELAWANFQPQEAIEILRKHALPLNPVCEETLGRLAAGYAIVDDVSAEQPSDRFTRLVDEVVARNPHAGSFFLALALWLDDRNRFVEAERFYRESIRRMPQLLGPKAHLGMMLMRWGREGEARGLLEDGFKDDPFNVRVKNTLELFEVLDAYETVGAGDCLLRFDGQRDKLLGRYAAWHLKQVYPRLCAKFGYRPAERPLVEVFNAARGADGQQWFGTRMIGLPYVGTVAASTGKIVGMVSPTDPRLNVKFNWAQTLTHELVHVITLQQTRFNIPHWYTEGLAVWCEGYPRSPEWNDLLLRRVAAGELFNLDTINFGFSRPRTSDDRQLAYCQAELYVEYMLEGRGEEVLRALLTAYAENLGTDEAIRRVFGMTREEFERGYGEYLQKIVDRLAGPQGLREERFAAILEAYEANPEDVDRAAALAHAFLRRNDHTKALTLVKQVLSRQPKHQRAGYVLAQLCLRAGRTEAAVTLLEKSLDPNAPEPKALNLLASLKLKAEDYAEAARLYELGARCQPYDIRWLRGLASAYQGMEDRERLAEAWVKLARGDPAHLHSRVELARMALRKRDYPAAVHWANQALEIDVRDASTHRILAEALADRHNYLRAIEEYKIAIALEPDLPQPQLALADAYLQMGQTEEARRVLETLLKHFPDYVVAEQLLETLKEKEDRDGR